MTRREPFRSDAPRGWAAVVLGLGLLGCQGGQTGGETRDGTPVTDANGQQCRRSETSLGVEAMSALGFSANDVLAYALGARSASLFWNSDTAPATYGPERGESRIELELEYRGGGARFVAWSVAADAAAPVVVCPADTLEIEVSARLSTSGGALAETFDTRLVASAPANAQLSHTFALSQLMGSFEVQLPESVLAPALTIDVGIGSQSFSGSLWSPQRLLDTGDVEAPSQGAASPSGAVGAERERERSSSASVAPPGAAIIYATWPSPLRRDP